MKYKLRKLFTVIQSKGLAQCFGNALKGRRVFKQEHDACRASFDAIDWKSEALGEAAADLRCPHCSSALLRNANAAATRFDQLHLVCSKCGEGTESEIVFEEALERTLEWDAHEAAKEGSGPPLENTAASR